MFLFVNNDKGKKLCWDKTAKEDFGRFQDSIHHAVPTGA